MMSYLNRILFILYLFSISLYGFSQDHHENQHNDIKFVENKGQWQPDVLYRALIPDGFLFLENKGLTYLFYDGEAYDRMKHGFSAENILNFHALKVQFLDANKNAEVKPSQETSEYYNFFLGNDKSKWASGAKGFFSINYNDIYPGIDAVINGVECQLEYSFYLKPNADPKQIRMKYNGVEDMFIQQGDLHVVSSISTFIEFQPQAYSIVNGLKQIVECGFKLDGDVLSYNFPHGYNPEYPLVIDPIVIFSTFSGSVADNFGYTATYDDSGYAYSGGTVFDVGFPTSPGAFQDTFAGGVTGQPSSGDERDIGILKYTPDGTKLVYCTYLGGTGNEDPHSMVVNSNFELLVFGNTCSNDFPMGPVYWDNTYNGNFDIVLAKLSIDGKQLLASTFVGGSGEDALNGYFTTGYLNQSTLGWNYGDIFRGEVIVDSSNNVYVITTTKSLNFPVTPSVFQPLYGGGKQDACIIKLAPNLNNLLKSSYIGGLDEDAGYGIVLDQNEDIYVCGGTKSSNLSVATGKYQQTFKGGEADGFIYKISSDFLTLLASTYLGTPHYDQTYFIQTDKNNNVFVTGQTKSDSFPIRNVKYSKPKGKQFIVKFKPLLDSIIFSSVFGSGSADPDLSPSAFLVDNCERIYFSGWGGSTNQYSHNNGYTWNLPVTTDAFQKSTDGSDFYLAVFAKNFDALLYGSYFGGALSEEHVDGGTSRFDKKGVVYQSVCGGCGGYSDFPTTPNAWSRLNKGKRPGSSAGGCNNALFKLDLNIPDVFANFTVDTIPCLAAATTIKNKSLGGLTYFWDFGDGDTSSAFEPKHVYNDTGIHYIKLVVRNMFSCTTSDSIIKPIVIYNRVNSDFVFDTNECVNTVQFKITSKWGNKFKWNFGDLTSSIVKNPVHVYKKDTATYKVILYVDSGTVCENRVVKTVKVKDFPLADFTYSVDTCRGRLVFTNLSLRSKNWFWDFGDTNSSIQKNPVHDYLTPGKFGIILYAEPGKACADTSFGIVDIKVPRAHAIVLLDTCNLNALIYNPSKYVPNKSKWFFGDGDSLFYSDSVLHQYMSPGSYNISLIANFGTVCEDTVSKNIIIPYLPIANYNYKITECSPFVVFKNQSSYSNRFDWQFSTGYATNQSDSFIFKFDSTGKYIISLISYSFASCSDTIIDTLLIEHLALADFNFSMDTCNSEVRFNNLSTKSGSCFWDFGDQKQSNIPSPIHVYDSAGSYQVALIVQDNPCVDSIKKTVNIFDTEPITFDLSYDSCSTKVKLKPSRNNAVSYYWLLGDGSTSSKNSLDYIYKQSGNYKIKLIVNSDTFCTDSTSKEVSILKYEFKDIDIPNIFTPNNDSKNELFTLLGLKYNCDVYKLWIYNRWGELVFESLPNVIEWDGKTEGKIVSPGTYYFILRGNGFEKTGTITVVY